MFSSLDISVAGETETTTNTYDPNGQLLTTTDPRGGVSTTGWNGNGAMTSRTDAAEKTTTLVPDPLGRITAMIDPLGNETGIAYDNKDRIRTLTDPYDNVTSFGYDDAGRRTTVTTPRGTTRYDYDAQGRVVAVTDPLGNVSRTVYNAAGDVLSRTDARGNITRYEYDRTGRVIRMTDPLGGVWEYDYCAAVGGGGGASCSSCSGGGGGGNWCDLVDPNGNRIHREFDRMGRVVSMVDSLANTASFQYDAAGRKILETDANGNSTGFGYDEAGRLTRVTEASGAITRYAYDKAGNKVSQTDANNHTWTFGYDALNRIAWEKDPLLRQTTYTYDDLGNLATKTDGNGVTATYVYNIRRLTSVNWSTGKVDNFTYDALGRKSGQSNSAVTQTYVYDALNRLTEMTQSFSNGIAATLRYGYDAAGNLTKLETPVATSRRFYDPKNRLVRIEDTQLGTYRLHYDPMDRRTRIDYPNGMATSYSYDESYRMTGIVTRDAGGQVQDAWSYTYDAVGNRRSKTDMTGTTEHYSYDSVYRLTDAVSGAGWQEHYRYDPVGNRLERLDEREMSTAWTYDAVNQMVTEVSSAASFVLVYDGNGNVLTKKKAGSSAAWETSVWDAAGRLTSFSGQEGAVTAGYAPDGMRVRSVSAVGGNAWEFRDPAGNPVMDDLGSLKRYRLYGPGMDDLLGEYATNDLSRRSYMHRDALGSVTLTTSEKGVPRFKKIYRPFGEMRSEVLKGDGSTISRIGYTGREEGVGGLMYYRSRWYDSGVGRFVGQDGYRGEAGSPPSLHRYTYVHNNPVRYADPRGEDPMWTPFELCIWEILGLLGMWPSLGIVSGVALDVISLIAIIMFILWPTGQNHPEKYLWTAILAAAYALSIFAAIGVMKAATKGGNVATAAWSIAVAQLILYELTTYYAFGELNPIVDCMKL